MPSNTTYNPVNVAAFEKSKLYFNAQGVSASCTAGTSTNIDYTLVDDCLLTGLEIIVDGAKYGDYANLQVIDPTGITGAPPGTVILQPATNWYVATSYDEQYDLAYPAKIYTGLTLRIVYTSTGIITPVFVAINYKLHKILV